MSIRIKQIAQTSVIIGFAFADNFPAVGSFPFQLTETPRAGTPAETSKICVVIRTHSISNNFFNLISVIFLCSSAAILISCVL